jgi:hypothetical protein
MNRKNLRHRKDHQAEDRRIRNRARTFAEADASWTGPGETGLMHWRAAYDLQAVPGRSYYK